MIKSAVGCESSEGAGDPSIVSSSHVGRRVEVDGVGEGTLRYVGGINGKNGLFCGVELDGPFGKHDGSFQGFSYFSCPPLHGIFAPLYKVVLVPLPSATIPQSATFLQEKQRLSRSALPSLELRSIYSPSHSPMQTSQSSMASSLLNQSYVMNGSWQFGDDMLASNNTYVLPSRAFADEDDLMSVQVRDSILDRVLAEMPIATSLVLEESRVGVENLPVIGSPLHSPYSDSDDGVTPMVERRIGLGEEEEEWREGGETPVEEHLLEEEREEEAEPAPHLPVPAATATAAAAAAAPLAPTIAAAAAAASGATTSNPVTSTTPARAKKPTVTKKTVEPPKKVEERPKKERAPLCPPSTSIPKFPVKPKTPSKHQLMMEKLKASMEAEKEKKEKEKERKELGSVASVDREGLPSSSSSSMAPPVREGREGAGSSMSGRIPLKKTLPSASGPSTSAAAAAATSRVNGSAAPAAAPSTAAARKPRVSLLPPPPKKEEKKENGSAVVNGVAKRATATPSSSSFPSSSFAPRNPTTARKKVETKNGEEKRKKSIGEEEKLARLARAALGVDAMGVAMNRMMEEKEREERRGERAERERAEAQSKVDQLVLRLNETEKTKRAELEELHSSNEKAISSLRDELARQLEEKERSHEGAIAEERRIGEERVEELTARHQQSCALLDEKNAETERALEEAMREKRRLQAALETDHDTKVQTLSQEISSLNTALQLKSSEMKELRQKNQQLTMRVEEIPGKDLEISKMKHKIHELKLQLDQKHEREKLLVQQNEELRRKERTSTALSESYRADIDVLQFQLGLNGESAGGGGDMDLNAREGGFENSGYLTPVRMRKNRTESTEERPYSYTLPSSARLSQSRNSDDSMTRSVMGMFSANRGVTKMSALDRDVIYAPDQILTSAPRKLFGESEEEEEEEKKGGGTSDSGIGI